MVRYRFEKSHAIKDIVRKVCEIAIQVILALALGKYSSFFLENLYLSAKGIVDAGRLQACGIRCGFNVCRTEEVRVSCLKT